MTDYVANLLLNISGGMPIENLTPQERDAILKECDDETLSQLFSEAAEHSGFKYA